MHNTRSGAALRTVNTAEAVDKHNPEWSQEDFTRAVPLASLPASPQTKLRRVRGPNKAPTKERITIRLSPDVLQSFRDSGDGWQSRIDLAPEGPAQVPRAGVSRPLRSGSSRSGASHQA